MVYSALLRGVNVGGKNTMEMKRLKEVFVSAGMRDVITYINSGNVIFSDDARPQEEITGILEAAILESFGLSIPVLVRDMEVMDRMAAMLPDSWKDDAETKCNAIFLWDKVSGNALPAGFTVRPAIDTVLFTPEVVLWRALRKYSARSGLLEIIGSAIYNRVTVRNVNTARKIHGLMKALDQSAGGPVRKPANDRKEGQYESNRSAFVV
jgi:uncharacterized protein (DUF1697 family)